VLPSNRLGREPESNAKNSRIGFAKAAVRVCARPAIAIVLALIINQFKVDQVIKQIVHFAAPTLGVPASLAIPLPIGSSCR